MKKNNCLFTKKGFTLLELMVVVAIIGILTAIVMIALGDSRNKGGDAAVKSNLNTIRGQAELFYANNGNSFLPAGGSTLPITGPCPTYNASSTNMLQKDKVIANAIAEAVKRGSSGIRSACYNSSIVWVVAVPLKSNLSHSWCVDSGGNSKEEAYSPTNSINTTTFSCN